MHRPLRAGALSVLVLIGLLACQKDQSAVEPPPARCLAKSKWTPEVTSTSQDESVTLTTQTFDIQTRGSGYNGGPINPATQTTEITFALPEDLGPHSSITLEGVWQKRPTYPMQVALVGLKRLSGTGTPEDPDEVILSTEHCYASGWCGTCGRNNYSWQCHPQGPAYGHNEEWAMRQIGVFGETSVNVFPRRGMQPLRSGTYAARFAIWNGTNSTVENGRVTLTVKNSSQPTGSVKINLFILGSVNQEKAGQNQAALNSVMQGVQAHLAQSGVGITSVSAYDWTCDSQGNTRSSVDLSGTEAFFDYMNSEIPDAIRARAVSVYVINDVRNNNQPTTILGLSGYLGAPAANQDSGSGILVAAFENFGGYAAGSPSALRIRDVFAHEIGHYLGLNHTTESIGGNDFIEDTPNCPSGTDSSCAASSVPLCDQQCPQWPCLQAVDCGFNFLMWWQARTHSGQGSFSNFISQQQGRMLRSHPMVR